MEFTSGKLRVVSYYLNILRKINQCEVNIFIVLTAYFFEFACICTDIKYLAYRSYNFIYNIKAVIRIIMVKFEPAVFHILRQFREIRINCRCISKHCFKPFWLACNKRFRKLFSTFIAYILYEIKIHPCHFIIQKSLPERSY